MKRSEGCHLAELAHLLFLPASACPAVSFARAFAAVSISRVTSLRIRAQGFARNTLRAMAA